MKRIILLLILLPVLFSCKKDELKIDPDNLLIGVWNQSGYRGNTMVFSRHNEFVQNTCLKFNADGTLLERKNSGWCGTPPISYADYDGTWMMLNDTIIKITSGYWGGTMTYMLDIESVTSDSLKIAQVYDRE